MRSGSEAKKKILSIHKRRRRRYSPYIPDTRNTLHTRDPRSFPYPKPQIYILKPENRNPEPGTQVPDPGTRNPEQEICITNYDASVSNSDSRIPNPESRNATPGRCREREFFIDNLLVQIHFIIEMIKWAGLAPWEFEFPFSGSLISTCLAGRCSPRQQGPCASAWPAIG